MTDVDKGSAGDGGSDSPANSGSDDKEGGGSTFEKFSGVSKQSHAIAKSNKKASHKKKR